VRARLRSAPSATSLIDRLPDDEPLAVVRDGPRTVVGLDPSAVVIASGPGAFPALARLTAGWWAGFLSYDLGRMVERVPSKNEDGGVPDVAFARFDTRIVIEPDGEYTVHGDPAGLGQLLEQDEAPAADAARSLEWASSFDHASYSAAVARIHEHLLDGDCYQVNLTRTLTGDAALCARSLFRALRASNPAPHESFLRIGDTEVVSASPERFLRVDGRDVVTRPIKGTGSDPDALRASAKDRKSVV